MVPLLQRAAGNLPAVDSALGKVKTTGIQAWKFRLKVPADLHAVLCNAACREQGK